MSGTVVSIYDYPPRLEQRPLPSEPAVVVTIPVIRRPNRCCVMDCTNLGTVAIDVRSENGEPFTKFFCCAHDSTFAKPG